MDDEERKKKLEAGKERLAAFRKRKAKKKKRSVGDVASGGDLTVNAGVDGNSADISSSSDVQSLTEDSDQLSFDDTSGDEWSGKESELHSAVYYQSKLSNVIQRVAELEEMVEGKQLALDKLVSENEALRSQQASAENQLESKDQMINQHGDGLKSNHDFPEKVRLRDVQMALGQRDAIIQQLTVRLRATLENSVPDCYAETQNLAKQVAVLQQQLMEAGEVLQAQMNHHSLSSKALQEAKAEILSLQVKLQKKDDLLAHLKQNLTWKSEEVINLGNTCNELQARQEDLQKELLTTTDDKNVLCMKLHDQADVDSLRTELEKLEADYANVVTEMTVVKACNAELEAVSVQKVGMHEHFEDLESQVLKLTNENMRLLSEVTSLKSDIVDLKVSSAEFQEEARQKQSENDRMKNKINDQQGEIVDLRAQLEMLEDENFLMSSEVVKQMVESKEAAFASELKAKVDDILALKEEHQRYKDTIAKLNAEIQMFKNMHLKETVEAAVYTEDVSVIKTDFSTIIQLDTNDGAETISGQNLSEANRVMRHLDPEQDVLQHYNLNTDQASVDGGAVLVMQSQHDKNSIVVEVNTNGAHDKPTKGATQDDPNDEKTLSEKVKILISKLKKTKAELNAKQEALKELASENDNLKLQLENMSRVQEELNQLQSNQEEQNSQYNEDKKSLQNMVDILTAKIEELQSHNSELSVEQTDQESVVQTLLTEKHSLEESIAALKTDVERMNSESQCLTLKLESDHDHHEKEFNQLEEECKTLRQQNENIMLSQEEMLKHHKEQLNSSATDIDTLRQELADAKAGVEIVISEKHRLAEEIQIQKEASQREIQCLRAELEQARQEIQRTVMEEQQQKSSTEIEVENLSEELTKLQTKVGSLEAQILNEQNLKNQYETENSNLSNEVGRLKIELEESRTAIQNLELDKTKLEDDVSKANADVQKITSDCESMKSNFESQNLHVMEEIQQYEASIEQMKTDIENTKITEQELRQSLQMQYENSQEEVSRLQMEVNQARVNLEQLEGKKRQEAEASEARLCESAAEIEQLKRDLSQSRVELDNLQASYTTTQEEYQEFQSRTQQQIDTLEKSLEHANEETEQIIGLNDQKQACHEASLAAAHEELEQLKTEATKAKSAFESQLLSSTEELTETQIKLENLEKRLKDVMDRLKVECTTRVEVEFQSENVSGELRNLQNMLDVSKAEVNSLQGRLDMMTEKVQNEQTAKEEIQNHCDSLTEELDRTIQDRDDLQLSVDNHIEVLQALKRRLCDELDDININTLEDGSRVVEGNMTRMKLEMERLLILVDDRNSNITELELAAAKKNEDMEIMTEYTNTLKTELTEVKICLEEKLEDVSSKEMDITCLQSTIDILKKEKEVLKNNFDSCLEEMQSKIAEQEGEIRNLMSQLVENMKNNDNDEDIKMTYETHISTLEDKLEKAEVELEEVRQGFTSALDDKRNLLTAAENQLAELEDTCNGLVNENARLKEQMEKKSEIFQREKCDLQKMHEAQIAEMDDNCRTLEENISRLQSQMSEQAKTFEQQQNELEMNYENQLADIEDRCRILDMENGKLKHHLEEMAKDHKQEKEHLHSMFENQIIELEDRCRENENKSGFCQQKLEEQLFDSEQQRQRLEQQVQELNDRCRELEQSRTLVHDRLAEAIESSKQEKSFMEREIAQEKQTNQELEHQLCLRQKQEPDHITETPLVGSEAELRDDLTPNGAECKVMQEEMEESHDAAIQVSQNNLNIPENQTLSEAMSDAEQIHDLEEKIKLLSIQNGRLKEAIMESKKITQSQTCSRRFSFPTNDDIFVLRSTVSNLQMQTNHLSEENDAILTDLQNERERLNAAMRTVEELKEGLRSARTVFDEIKADHQNEMDQQKAESDREIEELREKLVAWEMELIQRRQLVDSSPSEQMIGGITAQACQSVTVQLASSEPSELERDGTNSESEYGSGSKKAAELVRLVADYEQKVGHLSLELTRLQSEYQTSKNVHEAEVLDLRKRLDDQDEVDLIGVSASAFKRECDAVSLSKIQLPSLQSQTKPPSNLLEMSGEFQPESVGSFEPEILTPEIDPTQNRFHLESELHQILPSSGDHISFNNDFEMDMELLASPKQSATQFLINNQPVYHTDVGTQANFSVKEKIESNSLSIGVSERFDPEGNSHLSTETSLKSSLSLTVKPIHLHENVIHPDTSTQTESAEIGANECTQQDINNATELLRRQLTHEKDMLEEDYIKRLRMQEVEITHACDAEKEKLKKELEQRLHKKMSAITIEKEQQFIKALRKVRKQLEARHEKELERIRRQASKQSANNSPVDEQDEIVLQLKQENQELAEARDALLKQVNMTQTQQTWLQDELDTVLSEQGSQPSLVLPDMSRADDDLPPGSPSFPSNSAEFLEELEKLSKLSSCDVPLEWELSMFSEDGVFDKELDSSGPCTKYECTELKRRYDHLVELFNKVQGTEDGAFVEEPQVNLCQVTDVVKKSCSSRICNEENDSLKSSPRSGDEISNINVASMQDPLGTTDNDFMDGDFRQRIIQLETDNLSLEQKLSDQLDVFSSEKQHLQRKCEKLQISLDQASLSGRELEQELMKQNDVLQQTVSQLRQEIDQRTLGPSVQAASVTVNLDDDQKMQIQYLTTVLETKEVQIEQLQNRLQLMTSNQESTALGKENDVASDLGNSEFPFEGKELDRVEHVIPGTVPKTIYKPRPSEKASSDELRHNGSPQHADDSCLTDNIWIDQSFSTIDDNLNIEHSELIEELHKIQQKNHELKMIHAEEKALLQEELEREKLTVQLLQTKTEYEAQNLFSSEMVELRKELAVLREFNKVLSFENKCFYERMRDQEHLVLCLKEELHREDASFNDWQNTFGRQLLLLQKQREQLLQQIENGHSKQNQLSSLLGEKTVLEETLRREKEILLEKLVQFEDLQQQLTQRGIHFEHFFGEQRRLEQLLLLKDENEKQLMRQKRLLQEELFEIEAKLREREALLQEEKMRLLREVKEKNVTIKKLESLNIGESSEDGMDLRVTHARCRRASMGRLEKHSQLQLGGSWRAGEQSYDEAIETLRNKLKMEYEAKQAGLEESHASQMASFWNEQMQKLESLKNQYEGQMDALRQELAAQKEQKHQDYLLLQDHHKEAVEKLREGVDEEIRNQLDAILDQLQKIYAAKIDKIENEHKEDIYLQVQAMRLSAEQVYNGQLELIRSDIDERHAADIDNLKKQHKDEINRIKAELSTKDSKALSEFEKLDVKLYERYQEIIQKISAELETKVLKGLQEDNSEPNDVCALLERQKEDLAELRSRFLSEHVEHMKQVEQLQEEIESLQQKYEEEVSTFNTRLQQYTDQDGEREKIQENQQKELDDLRAYYEKHVREMEKSFEEEISSLQAKYEENMSTMHIQIPESKDSSENLDLSDSLELSKVREYVHRTTNLTVISDSDESMSEASKQHNIDALETKVSGLEDIIREREKQIGDLEVLLEQERDRTSQLVEEVKSLKDQQNESQQLVDSLRRDLSDKEMLIAQMQEEKSDGEKGAEKVVQLEQDLCDSIQREKDLQVQMEDLVHSHKEALDDLRQELEHEAKIETETMQSEFRVQMEIELKRQAAELGRDISTREAIAASGLHAVDSVEGEVTESVLLRKSSDSTDGTVSNESTQTNGAKVCKTDDSVVSDKDLNLLKQEYTDRIDKLTQELAALTAEKDGLSKKHQSDIENMQLKLTQAQEKYDKLIEDIENGECPEVEDIIRDKIDMELELAKNLMQQEFDETLESERKRFMECHRKMMDDFMADRAKEGEELQEKHDAEVRRQREAIQQYEEQIRRLETDHNEQIQKLQEATASTLGDQQSVYIQTDNGDADDERLEKTQELQERHEKILQTMKEEFEEKMQTIQRSHDDALLAAAMDTEKVKSELEAAHQQELQDLEQQLQEKHEKEMRNLEHRHQQVSEEVREQHQMELTQMQSLMSTQPEHMEEMRELSEVVLPVHTTSLKVELNSTLDSDVSGSEAQLKSTPREGADDEEGRRTPCSSPDDDLMVTRSFADVVRGSPQQSSVDESDQKDEKIKQLEATVKDLTERLEQYDQEEEVLSGRRQREAAEDSNLVNMLKSDFERISAERNTVQKANDHLLQTLSDSVKACVSVEDRINRNLTKILTQSASHDSSDERPRASWRTNYEAEHELSRDRRNLDVAGRASSPNEQGNLSQDSSNLAETSILSLATDEGLDVSQRFTDSIFTGPDLEQEEEEIVTDSRLRLQESVNKLLDMIEQSTQQLHETKRTQQELVEALAARSDELEAQQQRNEELEDRLGSEVNAKEYLALELSKAEGLLSGFSSEQEMLQQRIEDLEEKRQTMAQELELTQNRLRSLQQSQDEVEQLRLRLERQQTILQENVGDENQEVDSCEQNEAGPGDDDGHPALLTEVNSLTAEKRQLEEHTQHQLHSYQARVQDLESVSEEQERHHEDQLELYHQEVEDLKMKLDKVERQLKANKQFIDEQSAEREQEREDFQRDIDKLQQQLRDKTKQFNTEDRLQMEVQELTDQLQNRIDTQTEILQRAKQLQKELQDKDQAAAELNKWVGQLELSLEEKELTETQLKQKIERLETQIVSQSEADYSYRSLSPSAESDQFGSPNILSPVRRTPAQRIMTLEDELKKYKKTEEDLMLEKEALQRTVQEQLLQISALRNQLDDMRHYGSDPNSTHGSHAAELREQLQSARDALEKKEQEVSVMEEELERWKKQFSDRDTEIKKLVAKLENDAQSTLPVTEDIEKLRTLEQENETLKHQLDSFHDHSDGSIILSEFAESLLKEKDSEIDDLNEHINQLQVALQAKETIGDDAEDIENLKAELHAKEESIAELQSTIQNLTSEQFSGDVSLTEIDRKLLSVSLTGKTTLQQELEESVAQLKMLEDKDTQTEEEDKSVKSTSLQAEIDGLRTSLSEAEASREELTQKLQAAEEERNDIQSQLAEKEREATLLQEDLDAKHSTAEQMTVQIDSLQEEITSLTNFQNSLCDQNELQKDFDLIQSMLENKQREMDALSQELTDNLQPPETEQLEKELSELRKSLEDKANIIEEKEEELYVLNEKLELQDSLSSELASVRQTLEETEQSLRQERELREQVSKQFEELQEQNINKTDTEKEDQKIKLADTEDKLREIQTRLTETESQLEEMKESLSEKEEIIKEKEIMILLQKADEDHQEDLHQFEQKSIREELETQISQLESKISQLEQKLQEKGQLLQSLEQKYQEQSLLLQSLQSEKDTDTTLLTSVADLQQKLEAQELLCDQYVSERTELDSRVKQNEEFIDQLKQEKVDVEGKLEAKEKEFSQLESVLRESKDQLQLETQRLEAQLEMKTSQESASESDLLERESRIETLSAELAGVSRQLKEAQERLDQTSARLAEREAQITQLQAELLVASNSAQAPSSDLTSDMVEAKAVEKEEQITNLKSSLTTTEQELVKKSKQLRQLETDYRTLTEEVAEVRQHSVSDPSPRELSDFHPDIRLARSESEPTLDMWRRSSSEFMSRVSQIEALTIQQKMELAEKNRQLSVVREQMERWLAKGQQDQGDVRALIMKLSTELKNISEPTTEPAGGEKERYIRQSQREVETVRRTLHLHQNEISELRTSNESLRRESSERDVSASRSEQQILHLKSKLRKAKSTLAEMHNQSANNNYPLPDGTSSGDHTTIDSFVDVNSLKQELIDCRNEIQILRDTAPMSTQELVKKIQDLRSELAAEHKEHIRDIQHQHAEAVEAQLTTLQLKHDAELQQLRQQHELRVEQALATLRQEVEKEHKSEMNRLLIEHQHQVDMLRNDLVVHDDASVVERCDRLRNEVSSTEQFDGRLQNRLSGSGLVVVGHDSDISLTESSSTEFLAEDNISTKLQAIMTKVHKHGLNILSLSEMQYLRRHMSSEQIGANIDVQALTESWERERQTFVSTINTLKELLSKVKSSDRSVDATEDWRSDLLTTLCNLFTKEREMLLAELHTYIASHPEADKNTIIGKLERRIQDQESLHRSAIDQVFHADRQSLLSEIEELRSALSKTRIEKHDQQQKLSEQYSSREEDSLKKERQLQRQIQVLEFKIQQEKVIEDDLRNSLEMENRRVMELTNQLSKDKSQLLDTQSEISSLQIQLSKAHDALEREQSRFTSVTDALEDSREKNEHLLELVDAEKRKVILLESQVADLKSHNKDYLDKESRFVEQLRNELTKEQERRIDSVRHAELEKSAKTSAQQELEMERRRVRSIQNDYDVLLAQLKSSLESERLKCDELSGNLERERQQTSQLQSLLDVERSARQQMSHQDQTSLDSYLSELQEQKTLVEDLRRALAREKQNSTSLSDMLDLERASAQHDIEEERNVARRIKRDLDTLQMEKLEIKRHLDLERERSRAVQLQVEDLQADLKAMKQHENEIKKQTTSELKHEKRKQRELEREKDEINIQLREQELESQRLKEQLRDVEMEVDRSRDREQQSRIEWERMRHEFERNRLPKSPGTPVATEALPSSSVDSVRSPSVSMEMLKSLQQRLEYIAIRIQDEVQASPQLQQDLTSILSQITNLHHSHTDQVDGSSVGDSMVEHTLQHNDHLTTFLSQVCKEKEELRVHLNQLEDELVHYRRNERHQQINQENGGLAEDRYMHERVMWANERLSLQMNLDTAERETERLQGELRMLRNEQNAVHIVDTDREKMQRLYGRLLRSESFRKALVYQKRYLLLLLGGYQDCEQETLMLIAQIGGYPSDVDIQRRRRHPRMYMIFRSAARVVVAIWRMKYMVRKWRRATRVGSPVVAGRINQQFGYVGTNNSFSPPRPSSSLPLASTHATAVEAHFANRANVSPSRVSQPTASLQNGDMQRPALTTAQVCSRRRLFSTPPTKDPSLRSGSSVPASSSARRQLLRDLEHPSSNDQDLPQPQEESANDEFIQRLENLETRLGRFVPSARSGQKLSRDSSWR
ncbi:A-kinase anchor protein 9-like isoform X3 [Gigantopelta aegis]|uniref:A-kinase anchor protein 9-like isoform X3 n=1 Tax=Gigantopelta aegis TaxID=1735272 RepID=UPI001B88837C|nr:A-kinase anchor protein 9-like isoform X3 [Gigantopelta aegis]